jgi:hypothetical protein
LTNQIAAVNLNFESNKKFWGNFLRKGVSKMAAKKMSVHYIEIEDTPGSLQNLLDKAAAENIDFHCFMACASGGEEACAYLTAKDDAALAAFAQKAGIQTKPLTGFAIEDSDKVGAAAKVLKPLADAGINGVAAAAMVCDGKFHLGIIVENADADAAEDALQA